MSRNECAGWHSQFLPCVVKAHGSFHSVVELRVSLTLMYLDFEVVFFTLANSQTKWKFGGAANDKCDDLNPTSNPSLVFAQRQTIEHLPVSYSWTFHAQFSEL